MILKISRYICGVAFFCFFLYSPELFAKNDLELVISPEEISRRLSEVAATIDKDYQGEDLTVVMVLKGAVIATSDFMRALKTPVALEYIRTIRHDANGKKTDKVIIEGLEKLDIKGKNVLLIDDACGTGLTLSTMMEKLKEKQPKSLKSLAVILFLIDGKRQGYEPDYWFFKLENRYIVGYGIDHKQRYRELPGIYELKNYD